jgi:exodeoxyribonuclease-5
MVALLDRQEWLLAAQRALRRCTETDNPDLARILCYTNRTLETLVPIARRALHGDLSDTMAVLPGEVLITRSPVMAPACVEERATPEDPEMCQGFSPWRPGVWRRGILAERRSRK